MSLMELLLGSRDEWCPPDARGDRVPEANASLGAVRGLPLGGVFGSGIGSGVGRVGGGVDPAVTSVIVGANAWGNPKQVWQPWVFDYSTPGAGRAPRLGLDFYGDRYTGPIPSEGSWLKQPSFVDPTGEFYGGIGGGPTDAMGLGAIGPRERKQGAEQNRGFGGLLEDDGGI